MSDKNCCVLKMVLINFARTVTYFFSLNIDYRVSQEGFEFYF
jgi:hypothetical protein